MTIIQKGLQSSLKNSFSVLTISLNLRIWLYLSLGKKVQNYTHPEKAETMCWIRIKGKFSEKTKQKKKQAMDLLSQCADPSFVMEPASWRNKFSSSFF